MAGHSDEWLWEHRAWLSGDGICPERAFAVREALGAKASDVGRSVVEFACGSAEDFTAAKFRTCWSDEYCTTPAPIAV